MISKIGSGFNSVPLNSKNANVTSSKVPQTEDKKSAVDSANVDKVKDIKEGIKNGTYKIDIDKLAEKMADDLV